MLKSLRALAALVTIAAGLMAAGEVRAQTNVTWGLQTGSNPRTLCVYDLSSARTCVGIGLLDSTGHLFGGVMPAVSATGTAPLPTTGRGMSIIGGSLAVGDDPRILALNYATSAYLDWRVEANTITIQPHASPGGTFIFGGGTQGNMRPSGDVSLDIGEQALRIRTYYGQLLNLTTTNQTALATPPTGTMITVGTSNTVDTRIMSSAFSAVPTFTGAAYGGTNSAKTQVLSGAGVASFNAYAYDGSTLQGPIASLRFRAAENIASAARGSTACIGTTPTSSSTLADGLCQAANAGVTIGSPSGGSQGAGTLNATGLYVNGTAVTAAGITALTGDVTATGPGSVAATLATVNANVGSFGSSTSIPTFTVNAKGLITAASGNVVIAPAGTLTGTTLASGVVTSSLTSVGALASGSLAAGFTAIPNARLAFSATTVNGQTCTLGSTCTVTASATNITVGSTTVTSGSATAILYNNAGTLGNITTGNNGVLVTSAGGVPSISSTIPSATQANITGTGTLTSGATGSGFTVAFGSSTFTGANALANGGTGQITAPLARTSAGLNIDQITNHGDSIYTILATDRVVSTSANLTAARVWTLPAANAVNAGQMLVVTDGFGGINGANTITLTAAGADTINGGASASIATQYSGVVAWSDGSSKWFYIPTAGGGGTGTVTSVTAGAGLSTSAGTCSSGSISVSGTLRACFPVNAQTGTTYTVLNTDQASLVTFTNGSSIAVTLPQAGAGAAFLTGWAAWFENRGVGTATITPTTSTVDGAANIALATGQGVMIFSDGTNYFTQRGRGVTSAVVAAGVGISVSGTCTITSSGTCTVANTGLGNVAVQQFTATGTYTPNAKMVIAQIECQAAGGGGGGTVNSGASVYYTAGGGGGGEYRRILATAATVGASQAVTIGAGGTAGNTSGGNGGTGGNSSVGTICVATGGSGGSGQTASGIPNAPGGAGGSGGTGTTGITGGTGGPGVNSSATVANGVGGVSFFGGGGKSIYVSTTTAGTDGGTYGGGASGASTFNSAGAAAGGVGGAGLVVITEYLSP